MFVHVEHENWSCAGERHRVIGSPLIDQTPVARAVGENDPTRATAESLANLGEGMVVAGAQSFSARRRSSSAITQRSRRTKRKDAQVYLPGLDGLLLVYSHRFGRARACKYSVG